MYNLNGTLFLGPDDGIHGEELWAIAPLVSIFPTSIPLAEGATAVYSLTLTSQPTDTVHITLTTDDQVIITPTLIDFTPLDWQTVQTVTVTAVDDQIAKGVHSSQINHTGHSSDPQFDSRLLPQVTIFITDNDQAGIIASANTLSLTEGGETAVYTFTLTSQPTDLVTITLSPDDQVMVTPTLLTFTPSNWQIGQAIAVTAVDDNQVEGSHTGLIQHMVSSNDTTYNNWLIPNITAIITDNDEETGSVFVYLPVIINSD